jgi:hypothetical protein
MAGIVFCGRGDTGFALLITVNLSLAWELRFFRFPSVRIEASSIDAEMNLGRGSLGKKGHCESRQKDQSHKSTLERGHIETSPVASRVHTKPQSRMVCALIVLKSGEAEVDRVGSG